MEESDIDKSPFATSQRIINFATVLGTLNNDASIYQILALVIEQQFIASISQKLEVRFCMFVFWYAKIQRKLKCILNMLYVLHIYGVFLFNRSILNQKRYINKVILNMSQYQYWLDIYLHGIYVPISFQILQYVM